MIKNKVEQLINLFGPMSNYDITESFDELTVIGNTSDLIIPDKKKLKAVIGNINVDEKVELLIAIDEYDPVSFYISDLDNLSSFILDVESIEEQKEDGSVFSVKVKILKSFSDSTINIYSYNAFLRYIKSLSLSVLLHAFNRVICNEGVNTFLFWDKDIMLITGTLKFVSNTTSATVGSDEKFNRDSIIKERAEFCSFNKSPDLQLIPQDFHIVNTSENRTEFHEIISKISVVICFTYLSDISEVHDKNLFYFKINGYKTIANSVNFDTISSTQSDNTFKIYKWIYSDGGISDKLGLARNLISMTIDVGTLQIDKSTLPSILSNYEIYLKENVQHYIQLKVKISDFLDKADAKANDIVVSFGKTFRNNLVAFIGYFFTVIIVRYVNSGNLDVLFTSEVAYLSLAFLGASFVILLLTIWDSTNEKERLITLYNKTKERYKYLLDESDLKRIFSNDEEHKQDINYINQKVFVYSVVWFLAIVCFTILVFYLSDLNLAGQLLTML